MKISPAEWTEAADQLARGYEEKDDLFTVNKAGDKDRPVVVAYDTPQIGPLQLTEAGLGYALAHWNHHVALLVARAVLRERQRAQRLVADLRTRLAQEESS